MNRIVITTPGFTRHCHPFAAVLLLALLSARTIAAPAELLFEDDFNQGIPGWTAVQPSGAIAWLDGSLLWQYDINNTNIW